MTKVTAVELTQEVLVEAIQNNPSVFEKVDIEVGGKPADFSVTLGATTAKAQDTFIFDGFRFTVPASAGNLDFVWYFNAPESWGHWYICPVEGDMKPGFRRWLNADKLYSTVDVAEEEGRLRVLQTLSSDYFEPGRQYVLWFRKVKEKDGNKLRGRICFALKDDDWDYENIENALSLKPMGAHQQIKHLGSRGGEILLDKSFFDLGYAARRIDNVFFSLRQTRRMEDGYFIAMEIACPPCRTRPSYAKIRAKYGRADFVLTAKETEKVLLHTGNDLDEDADNSIVTYYYDYFGFEVSLDDKKEGVQRVVTHANDYSILQPNGKEAHFESISMKNLTVFHKDDKEVGRLYYFLEGEKMPLCTLEPPKAKYKRDNEVLEYMGKGKWLWRSYSQDGKLTRKIPFENHQMNGIAEGYYSDGKKAFVASYKNGILDGTVVKYSEDGKETERTRFEKGRRKPSNVVVEQSPEGDVIKSAPEE
ncbi:MAG: hypothetical protein HQL32_09515 [Planctomycetes bacterium]|nr:hypothetical protein [Planctomycetota bacterium]